MKSSTDVSAKSEAMLVLAEYCVKQELPLCAFSFAQQIVEQEPGSQSSLAAFGVLEKIVLEKGVGEEELQKLISRGGFRQIPESLGPLMNYFVARSNFKKKNSDWGLEALQKVEPTSMWGIRLRLELLEEELRRKGSASEILERSNALFPLLENLKSSEGLLNRLVLFQARLNFELKKYETSLELYKKLPLLGRSGGLVLREMAWTHFHLGNYAEVLGLVKTLKAPYYFQSLTPELYLLEVLTLRRLCHYETVRSRAEEFATRYNPVVQHIKARRRLQDSALLVNLVFASSSLFSRVETVTRAREEMRSLDKIDQLPPELASLLKTSYQQIEQDNRIWLDLILARDLRPAAEQLLSISDQIQLIDYLSGLDGFRLNLRNEKRNYQAKTSEAGSFSVLFWPVNTEYWWDELRNYRVLVQDRCSERGP